MIPLSVPTFTGHEKSYVEEVFSNIQELKPSDFSDRCEHWFQERLGSAKVYLTKSCTQSLEMSASLLKIREGDEVIMPSFTHLATANAFARLGAIPVFVDIRPDTLNINEKLIGEAITPRTRGMVIVHYGGVACDMDSILEIRQKHNIWLVEDVAHGIHALYKDRPLGSMGDLACMSFDHLKNVSCGQGGAIFINNERFLAPSRIVHEHGSDKLDFLEGKKEFYSWQGLGSNHYLADINAACLFAQLEKVESIISKRLEDWENYHQALEPLARQHLLELPQVPEGCHHNAHIFAIKLKDVEVRKKLMHFLNQQDIIATFHYYPLHLTEFGKNHSRFHGEDVFTTKESQRLLRLPLYHTITREQIKEVVSQIEYFFAKNHLGE